jgi:two-component system phosphate regulon sensor histidine kinase PhoR
MVSLAQGIAQGDFSKRIFIRGKDEITDLAKAFNYMSDQIRDRINENAHEKSRLEAVFLSMFDGIMIVDTEGSIMLMNQALKEFLNVDGEPLGKRPLEIIRNIDVHEVLNKTLHMDKGVYSKEITVFVPDEKILLVHATPIIRNNKTEGVVLVFHDITNLRRLEKVRQDFVANVSHELRTPMTSIKGYAETLLEGALDDKENARDFLKIIYADSDRLARLIEDILDLSKIESGKMKMVLKPCALKPIIEKVVSSLSKQIQEKAIQVSIQVVEDVPQVVADEVRMSQVFFNLVDNAVKYSEQEGRVDISVRVKGSSIVVEIKDTGIGIPEQDLSRVFERFYRVDKARSREQGGTGLGLSIVKHIMQAHKGEISVQSTLGQGSTFTLSIPIS